jgi:predicted Zn-dependent protease with MMP-like domain
MSSGSDAIGTTVGSAALIEMGAERFEELVAEALDTIPDELAQRMDNVAVFVEDRSRVRGLLGLYQGVPLTARGNHYGVGGAAPDRITIFREAILARCRTEAQVVEQVRITVVHEVAHHFGIDDGRLRELGYG